MSTSASSSSSTLVRYRPAILALTALAAGYTIYYIHDSFWSPSGSTGSALHRRNAVHRRHHQRRRRQSSPSEQAAVVSFDSTTALRRYRDHETQFGTFMATYNGRRIKIPLASDTLPSLDPLVSLYNIDAQDATAFRSEVERCLLIAVFATTLPVGAQLTDPGGTEAFAATFLEEGFTPRYVTEIVERFNASNLSTNYSQSGEVFEDVMIDLVGRPSTNEPDLDHGRDESEIPVQEASNLREAVVDGDTEHSWQGGDEEEETKKEGQSLLNLLYHIAEDQARRDGYVHRHVTCNSCNTMPIRGIRYRCANCNDFDLCEQCEAMQVHPKTHVFYKVRIPAPFLGNPRQSQPVWYPGKPSSLPQQLSRKETKHFCKASGYEAAEVDALWDQFRCLAATEYPKDPNQLGMAIDRLTFDKCFIPSTTLRQPPPNLIYDRMFAYYDTNGDGLIGFEEFVTGLASLRSKNQDEKLKRVFQGYDIDCDGFVSRQDFLRMFRAFYAFTKELTREMIAGMEEDMLEAGGQRDIITSSQPLSSAFTGVVLNELRSRAGSGKTQDTYGDLLISDSGDVLRENKSDEGDLYEAVGDVYERAVFGNVSSRLDNSDAPTMSASEYRGEPSSDDQAARNGDDEYLRANGTQQLEEDNASIEDTDRLPNGRHINGTLPRPIQDSWHDTESIIEGAESALRSSISVDDTTDSHDLAVVREAAATRQGKDEKERQDLRHKGINERWERRHFYLDEENGVSKPKQFEESQDTTLSTPSNSIPEMENSVDKRRKAIKCVLASSSLKSFKFGVDAELRNLHWHNDCKVDTHTLIDLLINMAEQSYEQEVIAKTLHQLGLEGSEASLFVDWLIDKIYRTAADVQKQPPAGSSSQAPRPSRRSRSSSKVRFQDDVTDREDDDTRSTSSIASRSRPVGERWGAYGVPEPEQKVGREILYQMTQEGLNELLDPIFVQREDLAMEVIHTASERSRLRSLLSSYVSGEMLQLVRYQVSKLQKNWRLDRERTGPRSITAQERVADKLQTVIAKECIKGTREYRENVEDKKAVARMKASNASQAGSLRRDSAASERDQSVGTDDLLLGPPNEAVADHSPRQSTRRHHEASIGHVDFSNTVNEDLAAVPTPLRPVTQVDLASTELIAQQPLDVLLESAGYSVADEIAETSDNFYDPTLPHHRPSTAPEEAAADDTNHRRVPSNSTGTDEDSFDPTLPQHRPSTVPRPPSPPTSRTVSRSTTRSRFQDATTPAVRFDQTSTIDTAASVLAEDHVMDEKLQNKLKYFGMLEVIEQEDKDRGGPGRISFPEFEEIMKGPKGQKLGFVGAWIDMASF